MKFHLDLSQSLQQNTNSISIITDANRGENGVFMYMISGRGIKTGSARALVSILVNGASEHYTNVYFLGDGDQGEFPLDDNEQDFPDGKDKSISDIYNDIVDKATNSPEIIENDTAKGEVQDDNETGSTLNDGRNNKICSGKKRVKRSTAKDIVDKYYEAFDLKSEKDKMSESQGSKINLMSEETNATKAVRKIPNKSKKDATNATKAVRKIPNKSKKGTTNSTKEVRKIPNKSKKGTTNVTKAVRKIPNKSKKGTTNATKAVRKISNKSKKENDTDEENLYDWNDYLDALYEEVEDLDDYPEEDDETTNDKEDHLTLPSCGKYDFKF